MRRVFIAGVGMTAFGKYLGLNWKQLSREAVANALADAQLGKQDIQAAFVGNASAGVLFGQENIRGQVVLQASGIGGIPIFNIENACASSSTAFHLGWMSVASGAYDCVLIHGVEKMTHPDKTKSFLALQGGVDQDKLVEQRTDNPSRSIFMDVYAEMAMAYMNKYDINSLHLAMVAAKNHCNGARNPYAQYRQARTPEEILADRMVVQPFTRYMCAPITDGAAAVIICSEHFANKKQMKKPYIRVEASVTLSTDPARPGVIVKSARRAYEAAGIGPEEIDVFEIHDTTAAAELMAYEDLGLCSPGEAGKLISDGITMLQGAKPVNPSGGLEAKGHPIGATGLGQIVELAWQLRGEAGEKQIDGAKTALAQNAGGHLGNENAICNVTILAK